MTTEKIGTLGDRFANRIVRLLPGPRRHIETTQPIISFTFDDAPIEAAVNGAAILEDFGARGTFYAAGRLAVEEPQIFLSPDELQRLAARGHEIACHTYAHRKVGGYSAKELHADFERNAHFLKMISASTDRRNFAFPYGMTSPVHQRALAKRFRTSRSILPGINRGHTDIGNLKSVELRPEQSFLDIAYSAIDDVAQKPGWLIFFTHDVSETPTPFGCPSSTFRDLVSRAQGVGAKIMTVDAAADYFKLPK